VRRADEPDMLSLFSATVDGMNIIPDISAVSLFRRVIL